LLALNTGLEGYQVPKTWFEIQLAMPLALTAHLQRDIAVTMRPPWRVDGIEVRKLEEGLFSLRLFINSADLQPDAVTNDELREFRDLVVSLVAFSAMSPVHLRSKGIFDFPLANGQRRQTSLGPMNYEYPATPLTDLQSLVLGLGLESNYVAVLHFLWEALNSEHPLYRFINLAIATELVVRHDSPVRGSRHPRCGDPECGFELDRCPRCDRSWLISAPLRERVAFLLTDPDVRSRFIGWRNQVFHGLSDDLHGRSTGDLVGLNAELLVVIRNHLGNKLGLAPITRTSMSVALDRPEVVMTVFYSEARGGSVESGSSR